MTNTMVQTLTWIHCTVSQSYSKSLPTRSCFLITTQNLLQHKNKLECRDRNTTSHINM